MKRTISLILCLCLILCGCGTASEETKPDVTPAADIAETTASQAVDPVPEATIEATVTESTEETVIAESTEEENIWTPELLVVLFESTFKQNFSYAKATVEDDAVTVSIGNNGFGPAVSSNLLTQDEWAQIKDLMIQTYNSTLEPVKDPLNGRTFILNLVDETNPETVFLTVVDGEITFDVYSS